MKVISTNISEPKEMIINGRPRLTGIYKKPIDSIFLGSNDVQNDHVMNRKHHGGPEKACYVFSSGHYPYWKTKYPALAWEWGMFGENLTIQDWHEDEIRIGDVFKVGSALVETSSPRIPCNFLATKFKDKSMLGEYLNYHSPGTYLRVLQEGKVQKNDEVTLEERNEKSLSILEIYKLLSPLNKNHEIFSRAMEEEKLSHEFKSSLKKKYPAKG